MTDAESDDQNATDDVAIFDASEPEGRPSDLGPLSEAPPEFLQEDKVMYCCTCTLQAIPPDGRKHMVSRIRSRCRLDWIPRTYARFELLPAGTVVQADG